MSPASTGQRAEPGSGQPTAPPKPPRSARRLFSATVLGLQAFIVFFATLAAYGMRTAPPGVLIAVGIGGAVLCLVAAALLRNIAGYILGSVIQVAFLVAGFLIPDLRDHLLAVAVTFAVIWVVALTLGARIDVERAERYRGELEHYRRQTQAGTR